MMWKCELWADTNCFFPVVFDPGVFIKAMAVLTKTLGYRRPCLNKQQTKSKTSSNLRVARQGAGVGVGGQLGGVSCAFPPLRGLQELSSGQQACLLLLDEPYPQL